MPYHHERDQMKAKTHIIAAGYVTFAAYTVCHTGLKESAVILTGAAVGTLMPDIDKKGSKISNKNIATGLVSGVTRIFTSHRGVTHTIIGSAAISALLFLLLKLIPLDISNGYIYLFAIAHFAGMITHMMLDSLNPQGIMWLWPFTKRRFHIANIRTGSLREHILSLWLILLLIIISAFHIKGS